MAAYFFSAKEDGLANGLLAADILHRQSGFRLPQCKPNLLLWRPFSTNSFNTFL